MLFAEVAKDISCIQCILRVTLGIDDLVVTECISQNKLSFFDNRSVILDCLATDSSGKEYNIEVQRSNEGASPLRARYHASALSVSCLKSGQDFKALRETYVIFITEQDYFKSGKAIYHIKRTIDGVRPFEDKETIMYVNGQYIGDDPIGLLMADFRARSSEEMHYEELRNRTKEYKKDDKEETDTMMTVETYGEKRWAEGLAEGKAKLLNTVLQLYKAGSISITAACTLTEMHKEEFEALAAKN